MSTTAREASARATPTPRARVVTALHPHDENLVEALAREGFVVSRCAPDALDAVSGEGAAAVVADADIAGTLGAVARLRRARGVASTLAVVLLGNTSDRAVAHVDAVEAGADVFLPRPVAWQELVSRLHALLGPSRGDPPPAPLPAPSTAAHDSSILPPPLEQGPGVDPSGLSPTLAAVLRTALGADGELALPALGDDSLDDLVPPELLEPLDAPLDLAMDELPKGDGTIPPLVSLRRIALPRSPQSAPAVTPLAVGGELRLGGSLGNHGAAQLYSAAARGRATGLLVLRGAGAEWHLALHAGHLMALRSSRAEDHIGPLLARLGFVPREAARFAAVPLDAGLRGAALLAARGYVAPDVLALALSRAAQEMAFDLLCVPALDWEVRALDTGPEIPLAPRTLDALLVLGVRARIEPAEAYVLLGGDEATVTLRSDPSALAALPLTAAERDAAVGARQTLVSALVRSHGDAVLPALAALHWLQHLRAEGPLGVAQAPVGPLGPERTRIRALADAAEQRDFLALLGLSQWATRLAAQVALDARRVELDTLRARYPSMEALPRLFAALDEAAQLLVDPAAWERYVTALRG